MAIIERWPAAPRSIALGRRDVHVWSVDLDPPTAGAEALAATLSSDERDRAARFHFDRDRRRFVHARGALRSVLAAYVDATPSELSFAYGAHGKPALGGNYAGRLSFNVSHSHDLALIAVAPADLEVGVDVEGIRSVPDSDDIACRFFAPGEVARLRAVPAAMRQSAFFRCWTRKEAYLKALGDGLARALDGFEVTFGVDEPVALRIIGDEGESARWKLIALDPAPDYAAALVVSRDAGRVECWAWNAHVPHMNAAGASRRL